MASHLTSAADCHTWVKTLNTVYGLHTTGTFLLFILVAVFKNIFCLTKNTICRPSDGVSDLHTVLVPISGAYLLSLGGNLLNHGGRLVLRRNRKEQLLEAGRTDIVDLNEVSCDWPSRGAHL